MEDNGSMGEFMNLVNQAHNKIRNLQGWYKTCYIGFELLMRYDAIYKLRV